MSFEVIDNAELRMEEAIEALQKNLSKVRTGRANPTMLEGIMVDYYGCPTPINQIASITIQEGKTVCIKPFDPSSLKGIEKAINMSSLGLPPTNDGTCVRITTPSLTEETRKIYCKDVDKMGEESKVQVRNIRRDANDEVKKDKSIPEDLSKSYLEDIQKLTDKYVGKVEETCKAKQKEIMTI